MGVQVVGQKGSLPAHNTASVNGYVIRTKDAPIGCYLDMRFAPNSLPGAGGTGKTDISLKEAYPLVGSATKIKLVFAFQNSIEGHKTTGTAVTAPMDKLTTQVMDFTATGSVYSGSTTTLSFQSQGSDSVPVQFMAPFGFGSNLAVSEWITKTVTSGTRLGIETNFHGCFQNTQNGLNPTVPCQTVPAGGWFNAITDNGAQPASRTQTSGNLSIPATGSPTNIPSPTGVSGPVMILGQNMSGATRPPTVLLIANSIIGSKLGSISHMMEGQGWNVLSWGHSGSAPDANWNNDVLDYYASVADLIIMADTENFLNPQYIGFTTFFGSSTSTNSQPLIDEQVKAVRKWKRPTFWVLPYLLGLNASNLAAQAIGSGTVNTTGYAIAIDYRSKVKAMLSADPTLGSVLDVYEPIIVDQSVAVPALPYIYKSDLLGDGTSRGVLGINLDPSNVVGGVGTDSNIFTFQVASLPTTSLIRTALNPAGGDLPGANNFSRLTAEQYRYFGTGACSLDAGLTSIFSHAKFSSSILYWYAGAVTNSPIGRTAIVSNMFGPFGRTNTFGVSPAITVGSTDFANSKARLDIPISGDNYGSAVNLNGLHLTQPSVTACWINALKYKILPVVNGWARTSTV